MDPRFVWRVAGVAVAHSRWLQKTSGVQLLSNTFVSNIFVALGIALSFPPTVIDKCTERPHMRPASHLNGCKCSEQEKSAMNMRETRRRSTVWSQSQSWFPLWSACRERFLSAPPVFRQTRRVCSFFNQDSTLSPKATAAGRCEWR